MIISMSKIQLLVDNTMVNSFSSKEDNGIDTEKLSKVCKINCETTGKTVNITSHNCTRSNNKQLKKIIVRMIEC